MTERMTRSPVTRSDYAAALLDAGSWPETKTGIQKLCLWMAGENTDAKWNPLATTRNGQGATEFNSAGVKNYPTEEIGLGATLETLLLDEPGYARIRASLTDDDPDLVKWAAVVEASAWGTKHVPTRWAEEIGWEYIGQ